MISDLFRIFFALLIHSKREHPGVFFKTHTQLGAEEVFYRTYIIILIRSILLVCKQVKRLPNQILNLFL